MRLKPVSPNKERLNITSLLSFHRLESMLTSLQTIVYLIKSENNDLNNNNTSYFRQMFDHFLCLEVLGQALCTCIAGIDGMST